MTNYKKFTRKIISRFFPEIYLYLYFCIKKARIKKSIAANRGKIDKTIYDYFAARKLTNKVGFVLGSGPTINKISKDRWIKIKENFCIGFNFWTLHRFVPNLYVYESAGDTEISRQHQVILMKRMALDYKNIDIIFKNIEQTQNNRYSNFIDSSLLSKQFYSYDFHMPYHTRKDVKNSIMSYGKYVQKKNTFLYHGHIPQLFSTPFWCTILLAEMGFTEIVYCGVDMYSPEYFFDNLKYNMFPELTPQIPRGKNTHKAFMINETSFIEVVDMLNNYVLKSAGINLFVENKKSLLSQVLPVWDY